MANSGWRVVADVDLCQGHQMCQGEAPDVFGFDTASDHVELIDEQPDDAQRRRVRDAVAYCPAMALAIHQTEHDTQGEDS